jgi:hypothetical protein
VPVAPVAPVVAAVPGAPVAPAAALGDLLPGAPIAPDPTPALEAAFLNGRAAPTLATGEHSGTGAPPTLVIDDDLLPRARRRR